MSRPRPEPIEAGIIKRIHMNRHVIRRNKTHGENEPPVTIQTSRGAVRAHGVMIYGHSRVVYSPGKPLKCGATVWIETRSTVLPLSR